MSRPASSARAGSSRSTSSVGAVVEEAGGELEIDQTSGMFFHRLQPGRVLYTQMGSAGDTGTGSMWHYLVSRGATRERLHVSEASDRRAFCSRQAIRGPLRASISDDSSTAARCCRRSSRSSATATETL